MTFTDQIQICIRLGKSVFQRRADAPTDQERNIVIAAISFIAEDYISMVQDYFLGVCPHAGSIGEVLGDDAEVSLEKLLTSIEANLPQIPPLELVLQLHFFTCAVRLAVEQDAMPTEGIVEVEVPESVARN